MTPTESTNGHVPEAIAKRSMGIVQARQAGAGA